MKKKILTVMFTLMLAGALAACGSKDTSEEAKETAEETEGTGELKYLADFDAKDYVALGEYKGVSVDLDEPEVSEEYL